MNINIREISNHLIQHSSLINSSSIFEHYIIEIRQPNNYVTLLPIYQKYTFETFMNDLNDFDLNNALIKIKMKDDIQTIRHFTNVETKEIKNKKSITLSNIIKNYYDTTIDIIFIFYFDNSINISYDEFKKLHPPKYHKHHYILHCQNIRELSILLQTQTENSNEEIRKLKDTINYLKEKNLILCQQLDELKLSSQNNMNNKTAEYLKLQLDYEHLQNDEHELKIKIRKYKTKLKEYININKNLNDEIFKLKNENKKLKIDNDEFYIAILNGYPK